MWNVFIKDTVTPLLLRLVLAAIFIFHGYDLVGHDWGTSWADEGMKKMNKEPPPAAVQALVAWGQLVGGAALALGLLTRLAALGIVVIMAGAIATVHLENGFDIRQGGYEYNVAIIVMCVVLILQGGGNLAVDRLFRFRRRET
jgi:putative oxidoreductase